LLLRQQQQPGSTKFLQPVINDLSGTGNNSHANMSQTHHTHKNKSGKNVFRGQQEKSNLREIVQDGVYLLQQNEKCDETRNGRSNHQTEKMQLSNPSNHIEMHSKSFKQQPILFPK
jgi:hypothetical protein